jgi:predicted TIM-barrel fold metal-dependent hydrolase
MDWIIDVHAHVNLGIGAQAKPKLVGRSDLTLERMLSLMDNHRIQACVLSVPESANFAIGQQASDLARKTNETLADIVSRYPTRFAAFATIPGQNIRGSIEEIGYALDVLKLDGVTTTTSINDLLNKETTLQEFENQIIQHYLDKYDKDVLLVAKKLDIGKSTIYRMIQNGELKSK